MKKKMVSMVLSIALVMSLFCNTTSFATGYSTDEPKGKIEIEISEDDSLSENVVDTLTNENVITQLDKIGISVDECQSYEILEEEDNGVKLQKDDLNYICLDQEGEIYRISTYSYEDAGYIANELQTYECTDAIVDECISSVC
ncbi:MAG: hypothetical protein SO101_11870 [Lachnospiraceae bacterium]|nr:hypothetical protein [Lachnospiraceae bacterium]